MWHSLQLGLTNVGTRQACCWRSEPSYAWNGDSLTNGTSIASDIELALVCESSTSSGSTSFMTLPSPTLHLWGEVLVQHITSYYSVPSCQLFPSPRLCDPVHQVRRPTLGLGSLALFHSVASLPLGIPEHVSHPLQSLS